MKRIVKISIETRVNIALPASDLIIYLKFIIIKITQPLVFLEGKKCYMISSLDNISLSRYFNYALDDFRGQMCNITVTKSRFLLI